MTSYLKQVFARDIRGDGASNNEVIIWDSTLGEFKIGAVPTVSQTIHACGEGQYATAYARGGMPISPALGTAISALPSGEGTIVANADIAEGYPDGFVIGVGAKAAQTDVNNVLLRTRRHLQGFVAAEVILDDDAHLPFSPGNASVLPFVVYLVGTSLYFRQAKDRSCSAWGPRLAIGAGGVDSGNDSFSVAVVNDVPAVAVSDGGTVTFYYADAAVPTSFSAGGATFGSSASAQIALQELPGSPDKPVVVYTSGTDVFAVLGADAIASSWGSPVQINTTSLTSPILSNLAFGNGNLLVAWNSSSAFGFATSADASTWNTATEGAATWVLTSRPRAFFNKTNEPSVVAVTSGAVLEVKQSQAAVSGGAFDTITSNVAASAVASADVQDGELVVLAHNDAPDEAQLRIVRDTHATLPLTSHTTEFVITSDTNGSARGAVDASGKFPIVVYLNAASSALESISIPGEYAYVVC